MTPKEKQQLTEALNHQYPRTEGFVWEMYVESAVDFIDNQLVDFITRSNFMTPVMVITQAHQHYDADRTRFNQDWADTLVKVYA